ncbi:DNA-binding PadR family transcriptional regulator [Pseudoclavibacter sp. JAI123]|uniref:PadR family transcriptional regulator n=1 Tax=Pseudoclavibacter sp. JAI123 TaxID=2723065 RepID=UPI0015CD91BA|nr:DNA-binding PadR family transcriptional regulator [Pseudoclavibacter sp. JAI123]
MTPPVFAHGHLRLYLLSLLEDQPRHGYELIQALSERFDGTYSPSAGTIYPRLAKLEEEGLVTKHNDGRKSVYRITEAGRRELDSRRDELAAIEQDVDSSVRRLAADVRHGLASAREELRAEFARLAQELGPDARSGFEKAASAGAAGAASARGFFAGAAKGWNEPRDAPFSTPGKTAPGSSAPGFADGTTAPGEPRPQDPPQAPPTPEAPGAPSSGHRTHGRFDTWASATSSHVWNDHSNSGTSEAPKTGTTSSASNPRRDAGREQLEAMSQADLVLNKFRHELRQELRAAQSAQHLSPGIVTFLDQELERVRERISHALGARDEKDAPGA